MYWDVANEITDERGFGIPNKSKYKGYNPHWIMPNDYAQIAFKESQRVFPVESYYKLHHSRMAARCRLQAILLRQARHIAPYKKWTKS